MIRSNGAISGRSYKPLVPSSSGHKKPNGELWMQIDASKAPGELVTFKSLNETGQIVHDNVNASIPHKVMNETKEYFKGNLPDQGLDIVEKGKEAFIDFGRQGDQSAYDPLEDRDLWKNFVSTHKYREKAHFLFYKYGYLISTNWDLTSRLGNQINQQDDSKNYQFFLYWYAEPIERWFVEFDRLHLAKDIWTIASNEEYDIDKKSELTGIRISDFFLNCTNSFWNGLQNYLHLVTKNYECSHAFEEEEDIHKMIRSSTLDTHMYLLSLLVSYGIGTITASITVKTDSQTEQKLVPSTLMSAVWVQFSEYIADGSKILTCLSCSQPFIRAHGQHRDKTHCSNACKQKAWRNSPEQKAKRQKRDQS